MHRIFLVIAMAVLLSSCTDAQTQNTQTSLPATTFAEKVGSEKNAQLVDVRTPEEFKNGHLQDAVNIDWTGNDFDAGIAKLDKTKPVFVYCLSGGRSSSAAAHMRKEGFSQVFEMTGGMMAWRSHHLPETKDAAGPEGMELVHYKALLQTDKLVLVDFYAEWCAPCKAMKPHLDKIAEDLKDKLVVVRIDADKNPKLCQSLGINSLPSLKLYKKQALIWEQIGYTEEKEIREHIQ